MSIAGQQHLFDSPQDSRDDFKNLQRSRASTQSRCPSCGLFAAYPQDFVYDSICRRCLDDPRPAIVRKVAEVKRWWDDRHGVPRPTPAPETLDGPGELWSAAA